MVMAPHISRGPSEFYLNRSESSTSGSTVHTITDSDVLIDVSVTGGSTEDTWELPAPMAPYGRCIVIIRRDVDGSALVTLDPQASTINGDADLYRVPPLSEVYLLETENGWYAATSHFNGGRRRDAIMGSMQGVLSGFSPKNSGVAYDDYGLFEQATLTDSASGGAFHATYGKYLQSSTATALGGVAHYKTTGITNFSVGGRMRSFQILFDTTLYRYWVGFSQAPNLMNSDDESSERSYAMFRASSPASDANWQFITSDGATQKVRDTLVPITATPRLTDWDIDPDLGLKVQMWNEKGVRVWNSGWLKGAAEKLPPVGDALSWGWYNETRESGVAKRTRNFGGIYLGGSPFAAGF